MRLNKSFYAKEIIETAITDFKEDTHITYTEDDHCFNITFEPENKTTQGEFANYLLHLIQND